MLQLIFFVFLFLTSTLYVDGLICSSNCVLSGHISNFTFPDCASSDKPNGEQSCRVLLTIDYSSGSIGGLIDPQIPPGAFNLDVVTIFSLFDESANVSIEYDCLTEDRCDQEFVKGVFRADWAKVQNEVKPIRKYLADTLFNSSNLQPSDICLPDQPCSEGGFCSVVYQAWTDAPQPTFASKCANSTEYPLFDWVQAFDQNKIGEIMLYTCNTPSCGSKITITDIVQNINSNYNLPINVTIPPTTTSTAPMISTTTTLPPVITTTTTFTMAPTTSDGIKSVHFNKIDSIIFFLFSIFFLFVF